MLRPSDRIGTLPALLVAWVMIPWAGAAPLAAQRATPADAGSPAPLGRYSRTLSDIPEPVASAFAPDGRLYVASQRGPVLIFDALGRRAGALATDVLLGPRGVAVAADGEVLVTDGAADCVVVFSPDGTQRAKWGRRGRAAGEFCEPGAISVVAGRVYVLDAGNARVQVFDRDGQLVRVIEAWPSAGALRAEWSGLAVDADGAIFVTDIASHRVQRLDGEGRRLAGWGDWGSHRGLLANPLGLTLSGGRVFVADAFNHRIQVFSAAGNPEYEWGLHVLRPHEGEGRLHYPAHVAISRDGALAAVCEPLEDRVQLFERMAPGERFPERLLEGPDPSAHHGQRFAVSGDCLAIVEPEGQAVQLYDASRGTPINITTIGHYGSKPGQFSNPRDVALDAAQGELLVLDAGNRRIQQFRIDLTPRAEVAYSLRISRLERCVSYAAIERQLHPPLTWPLEPVALDRAPDGRLFLLDARNARVVVLDEAWRVTAGFGRRGAASGELTRPLDLALTPDGRRVLIVDPERRSVESFDPDGRHLDSWGGRSLALVEPVGVAALPDGVVVVDRGADAVLRLDSQGRVLARWGGRGVEAGQFFKPTAAGGDARRRLIVLDHGNHRGQYFTADGQFLHAFGARLYVLPTRAASRRTAPDQAAPGAAPTTQPADPWPAADMRAVRGDVLRAWSAGGTYFVTAVSSPSPLPLNEPFELELRVTSGDDWTRPLADVAVQVDADMPEHRHGMNTRPRITRGAQGVIRVEGMLLHMPGYWEIYVDLTRDGVTERAQFAITVD